MIHLSFRHDLLVSGDLAAAAEVDLAALTALADGLAGSGKPLVGTGGTAMLVMSGIVGRPGTEHDPFPTGGYRIDADNFVAGLASRGVRSSVVRLPVVHSSLDHVGFITAIIASARQHGYAAYVGEGTNQWPAVHTLDAAELYRLALERPRPVRACTLSATQESPSGRSPRPSAATSTSRSGASAPTRRTATSASSDRSRSWTTRRRPPSRASCSAGPPTTPT
ncbi:hypothetical protein AB0A95_06545 [Micromonospora sp. NPDC049230]|uniref:hypothetical protein n=1 Tax=Micromonospora sp. NPDC049230 TaxID=3155502 RepID=UPI0033E3F162